MKAIDVELTNAEFDRLTSAVALAEATWEQDENSRGVKALLSGWDKILTSAHAHVGEPPA